MNSISKNSTITFSSQILNFILALISSIILARVLGPKGKGIYALIVLIPKTMLKLGTLGIEAANVYFTGSKKYKVKDIVSNSLLCSILFGFILILLFYVISQHSVFKNFLNSNQLNSFYVWLMIFTVPFSLLSGYLRNVFLGKEDIITYNKINILQNALQLAAVFTLLLILRLDLFGAISTYIFTNICMFLLVVFFIVKNGIKIYFTYNAKLFKNMLNYGIKAYFANLAQFLNYRLDMFLIAIFLTPVEVGYYSIAVGIAEKLWMLPGAIATVLFPRISSIMDIKANNLTSKIARNTFFIIFIFALLLAGITKPLIKVLFGFAFLSSAMPLLILLPGIVALSLSKILTADLAGRGKPQFAAYSSFVSLAVNIPLNLLLIPKWGISGAAFASTIAYIIATLIVFISFTKVSGKPWIEVLFIRKEDFQDYKRIILKIRDGIKKPVST